MFLQPTTGDSASKEVHKAGTIGLPLIEYVLKLSPWALARRWNPLGSTQGWFYPPILISNTESWSCAYFCPAPDIWEVRCRSTATGLKIQDLNRVTSLEAKSMDSVWYWVIH